METPRVDGTRILATPHRQCPEHRLAMARPLIRMVERRVARLFPPCRHTATRIRTARAQRSNSAAGRIALPMRTSPESLVNGSPARATFLLFLVSRSTYTMVAPRGLRLARRETTSLFDPTTTAPAHHATCTSIRAVLAEPCHTSRCSPSTHGRILLAPRAQPFCASTRLQPTLEQDRPPSATARWAVICRFLRSSKCALHAMVVIT